jgi:hypothetical protein
VICTLTVSVTGTGPSQLDLNDTVAEALSSCQARDLLNGTSHRVLSSDFLSQSGDSKSSADLFQATVYDYSRARSIHLSGTPFDTTTLTFTESNEQPPPNNEELADAASIAGASNSDIVRSSIPPVLTEESDDGTSQRILHLAITSGNSTRIVHVNMNTRTVVTPNLPRSSEKRQTCPGTPDAGAAWNSPGLQGQGDFTISLGSTRLWTFTAIRPSSSSGRMGSGVELRDVKYKGKTVLYRAHVPILNVEYEREVANCGPHYRDWQNEEYSLQCDGAGRPGYPPGFKFCSSPAKTVIDPAQPDGGNFPGVAVYIDGQEVVLKAQLRAGWYRYISEWRFHVNGELRPRWGFAGVLWPNKCLCVIHRHHAYWRFDFDIESPWSNLVREFNDPPINGNSKYHDKVYEIRRRKDASRKRHWKITNTRSGSGYKLTPGSNDGTSTAFGVGDVWILRYHGDATGDLELEDGVTMAQLDAPAAVVKEHIDNFLNGERVKNQDVVVWYAAHFRHVQGQPGSHTVGPTLSPVNW